MANWPKFLLSDCDGVIVDSETIAESVVIEVFAESFGRETVEEELHNTFGIRVMDILANLERNHRKQLPEASRQLLLKQIDDLVAERAPAMPKVKEVYCSLGLPVAVVSNSSPDRIFKSIQTAGIVELVDKHYYSGDIVPMPKPAPDVYLAAAYGLGAYPKDCVAIEDSVAGVKAAVAAGIPVVGFVGGQHIKPGHTEVLKNLGAFAVIDDFGELKSVFQYRLA
ncbi:HAD family phosphatase [Leeia sp. TBRC 13508]|uniref:HAD family phosphatase n=1 Tax=Leeia speluncae TaxID=2884804 RepID=A0ABS8D9Q9_9NEIS|nr:HAD family phosphatase [Leeia speluncae]MCB6184338.1 HAD family phosphatase [Leeia speluncae]